MAKKIFSSTNILSASGEIGGSPHRRVGPLGMIPPPIMFAPLVMFVSLKRFFDKSFFLENVFFFTANNVFSLKNKLYQVESISYILVTTKLYPASALKENLCYSLCFNLVSCFLTQLLVFTRGQHFQQSNK